jgi:5-methylcytosine-specific restriction endonuclease McrA
MKKETRQKVFDKYKGLCAYTGKPLGSDWQVDHVTSKLKHINNIYGNYYNIIEIKEELKKVDDITNLLPSCRIVNHYKRSLDLEGFRRYMMNFHKRLAKLPKKTKSPKTQKRKEYMFKVAELFEITIEKPFCGKFYFEKL